MVQYRDISVVIPAFNEEENIEKIVYDTISALKDWTEKFEIIVVDDGSSDNTYTIAQGLAAKGLIKVLRHNRNMGSGRAVLTGFFNASCHFVTYIGADGQFNPQEIKLFFPLMDDVDIIVAYRSSRSGYSIYRLFNSFVYLYLIRLLFGLNVRDINWVHIYRKEVVENIKVNSNGVFMLGEILIKANRKKFKIGEVRTSYYPRLAGKAKCSNPKVAIKAIFEIINLWLALKFGIKNNEN
ncbi:MAG: glycosyltransferase family 2 protein [Candidatus Omnitrophica bacterium]|nr:glycosyltransferase family 2 protein [Candidatus Omnitrophota bacterium]